MTEEKDPTVNMANVIAMADVARELKHKKARRRDPAPKQARNGAGPGKWKPNDLGLPSEDECPVEPIGFEGGLYHVIDASRQFRSLPAEKFSQTGIQDLFAPYSNYPKWAWPRYGRSPNPDTPPPIKSFQADDVKDCIFNACKFKGLFSPADRMRGRGAWLMRDGRLVFHAGEELWTYDVDARGFRELPTGMYGEHLYPRLPILPSPLVHPISLDDRIRTIGALLETLRTWHWDRPEVDPVLLLGWIGVAFLGGALEWRSAMLLLGDMGCGKSTLQDLLKLLFGALLFHSADTTAAAIYQSLRFDSRPVALDELEAGADPRKVANVVHLMRDASSGAMGRRGSAEGLPAEFQMRSAFLFSAINNPIQSSQDLSRVAILRMRRIDPNQLRPPAIHADICGRLMLSLLMSQWHVFPALREAWGQALAAGGHEGRGQDTYGTLLACAEMLLGPELGAIYKVPLSEDLGYWTEHLGAEALPEVEDAMQNWRACATWLLTSQVQQWRQGARTTVGQLIAELKNDPDNFNIHHARKELGLTGLYIFMPGEVAAYDAGHVLAIPNTSPLVAQLFAGTVWAGIPGAGGPWKDALRQAPANVVITDRSLNRVMIGGVQQRCTLLVLKHFDEAAERG